MQSKVSDRERVYGKAVGARVEQARGAAGLTRSQLAAKSGVGRPTIFRLESGNLAITLKNFLKVCRATGSKPGDILGDE